MTVLFIVVSLCDVVGTVFRLLPWDDDAEINSTDEFTVQEIVAESEILLTKKFGSSQVNQMLNKLSEFGLVFKNRHGKYSFAVPLLDKFIKRQSIELK